MNAAFANKLKAALVLAIACIAMNLPSIAAAGGTYISVGVGYQGGHYGHRYKHGYRHHGYKARRHHGYHGRGHHRAHRHHKPYGYHHYGYHRYSSGDLAAAALVGGLIGYGVRSYTYQHRYKVYRKPTTYQVYRHDGGRSYSNYAPVRTVVVKEQPATAPPARNLLKDRNGNCFEIRRNSLGDELRVHLPSYECNF